MYENNNAYNASYYTIFFIFFFIILFFFIYIQSVIKCIQYVICYMGDSVIQNIYRTVRHDTRGSNNPILHKYRRYFFNI